MRIEKEYGKKSIKPYWFFEKKINAFDKPPTRLKKSNFRRRKSLMLGMSERLTLRTLRL